MVVKTNKRYSFTAHQAAKNCLRATAQSVKDCGFGWRATYYKSSSCKI